MARTRVVILRNGASYLDESLMEMSTIGPGGVWHHSNDVPIAGHETKFVSRAIADVEGKLAEVNEANNSAHYACTVLKVY